MSSSGRPSRRSLEYYNLTDDELRNVAGPSTRPDLLEFVLIPSREVDRERNIRQMEEGARLYRSHQRPEAVTNWKSLLRHFHKKENKFSLFGHLFKAYLDWGTIRDSMDFAQKQLIIAEELDDPNMIREAHLNLAIAHEKMGKVDRILNFARDLMNTDYNSETTVLEQLVYGIFNTEITTFYRSLWSFKTAVKSCHLLGDFKLELQVNLGLSELFRRVQDPENSALFASKAYDISKNYQLGDPGTRHNRAVLLEMIACLTNKDDFDDVFNYTGESSSCPVHSSGRELHCGVCNMARGREVLPCCHILHTRCSGEPMRRTDNHRSSDCTQCSDKVYSSQDAPRENPENPENSENPENPENSENPENPEISENPGNSTPQEVGPTRPATFLPSPPPARPVPLPNPLFSNPPARPGPSAPFAPWSPPPLPPRRNTKSLKNVLSCL